MEQVARYADQLRYFDRSMCAATPQWFHGGAEAAPADFTALPLLTSAMEQAETTLPMRAPPAGAAAAPAGPRGPLKGQVSVSPCWGALLLLGPSPWGAFLPPGPSQVKDFCFSGFFVACAIILLRRSASNSPVMIITRVCEQVEPLSRSAIASVRARMHAVHARAVQLFSRTAAQILAPALAPPQRRRSAAAMQVQATDGGQAVGSSEGGRRLKRARGEQQRGCTSKYRVSAEASAECSEPMMEANTAGKKKEMPVKKIPRQVLSTAWPSHHRPCRHEPCGVSACCHA